LVEIDQHPGRRAEQRCPKELQINDDKNVPEVIHDSAQDFHVLLELSQAPEPFEIPRAISKEEWLIFGQGTTVLWALITSKTWSVCF
jgi:hypothetical protein